MDWWEKAKEIYGIDEEKIERMASVSVAEGGRIQLPDVGEELLVYITRNPVEVEAEKLKERGIEMAMFARCRKVEFENGEVVVGNVEYDLPMSKTMAMTAVASLKRHNVDKPDLEGKVFLITAREWRDAPEEYKKGKGRVKTYVMSYKPELTEKARKVVEAEEEIFEEEIRL